jgi:hypothetical protein
MTDLTVQPAEVEPVDVLERGDLHLVGRAPRSVTADQLGLVEADRTLGHRVIERVPDRSDRGGDPVGRQALGVGDRRVLGGFKPSSQHLDWGGAAWASARLGVGGDWAATDALTGATTRVAS